MKRHWNSLQISRKKSVLAVLLLSCSFFILNAADFSSEVEKEETARNEKLNALIEKQMPKALEFRDA